MLALVRVRVRVRVRRVRVRVRVRRVRAGVRARLGLGLAHIGSLERWTSLRHACLGRGGPLVNTPSGLPPRTIPSCGMRVRVRVRVLELGLGLAGPTLTIPQP